MPGHTGSQEQGALGSTLASMSTEPVGAPATARARHRRRPTELNNRIDAPKALVAEAAFRWLATDPAGPSCTNEIHHTASCEASTPLVELGHLIAMGRPGSPRDPGESGRVSESGCLDWGSSPEPVKPCCALHRQETERPRSFWPFGGCAHKGWPWILNMICRDWSVVIEAFLGWSASAWPCRRCGRGRARCHPRC